MNAQPITTAPHDGTVILTDLGLMARSGRKWYCCMPGGQVYKCAREGLYTGTPTMWVPAPQLTLESPKPEVVKPDPAIGEPRQKYSLSISINTDDDAIIIFEGKQYCFYGDNLNVVRQFESKREAFAILRSMVCIEQKRGLTEWFHDAIEDAIKAINDDLPGYSQFGGNQTMEIFLDEVKI